MVTFGFCRSSISQIIPFPYIAFARGSPCIEPSVDVKIVVLTDRFDEYTKRAAHVVVPDNRFLHFLEQFVY